jgi:hypothetical protein
VHVLLAVLLVLAGVGFGDLWRAAAGAGPAGDPRRPRLATWALRVHVAGALVASGHVLTSLWIHALAPLLYVWPVRPGPVRATAGRPVGGSAPGGDGRRLAWAAVGRTIGQTIGLRVSRWLDHPGAQIAVPALGTALALGLAALWLQRPDGTLQGGGLLFFFGSVVLSSVLGGLRPGLLATFLAVVVIDFFLLAPRYTFTVHGADAVLLGTFNAMAVLAAWLLHERGAAGRADDPAGLGRAEPRRWRRRRAAGWSHRR